MSGVIRLACTEKPASSARSQIRLMRRGMPPDSLCTSASAFDAERDRPRSAGDRQTVRDVRGGRLRVERLQLVADGDALIELPQLRRSQQRLQVQLADEDDLQQLLLVGLEIRQNADLLEHVQRQVLRLVDDEHGARLQRNQAEQEIVERVDQLLLADAGQPAGLDVVARDDAEVLQDSLQQILFGQERIQDQRGERRSDRSARAAPGTASSCRCRCRR